MGTESAIRAPRSVRDSPARSLTLVVAEQSRDCHDRAHASEPECGSSGPAHPGARLPHSLAFHTAVAYTVAGTVEGTGFGSLTMLRLPGDSFVSIELVHDPAGDAAGLGTGVNHLVV
jgi:hypothetical protein